MIDAIISAGVIVAVPLTGAVALGRLGHRVPTIALLPLWTVAGLAVWSVPLLGLLIAGVYQPEWIGAAGWVVFAAACLRLARELPRPRLPRPSAPEAFLLGGVIVAAAVAAASPQDPFATGRDMATYASHAVYMVDRGRLDIPYPWPEGSALPDAFARYAGVHPTETNLTVRFGHVYPAWLAQTYAVAGVNGMLLANVVLGALSLLLIYAFMRPLATPWIAAVLVGFLALNPAQIWTTRTTLSEVPTQLVIWAGLTMLLLYLKTGRRWWGIWAGAMLGLSAVVRIDGFLLLPFLIIGHAAWTLLRPSARTQWRWVYVGTVPVFAGAIVYYALFSRPYLLDLSTQLLLMAALTVLSLGVLALTAWPSLQIAVRRLVRHRAFPYVSLALVVIVGCYAYFIRPAVPPFAVFEDLGALTGSRTHVEDALPNLGRYLTPGIVWLGLVGAWAVVIAAIRNRRSAYLLPFVTIAMGCTAVYVWNQSVTPDHFWAIRRFVPVVIPGLVVLAGLATALGMRRLSRPGRRFALRAGTVGLLAFTLLIGLPTYVVSERAGAHRWLKDFAETLPNAEMMAIGSEYDSYTYWTPLLLAFHQPVVPYNTDSREGWQEAVERLERARPTSPVVLLTTLGDAIDGVTGARIAESGIGLARMDNATYPVPMTSTVEMVALTAIEATGYNALGVELGGRPQWLAYTTGFHRPELVDGQWTRWTDGHARLLVPYHGESMPGRLVVDLAEVGVGGSSFAVLFNGTEMFSGDIAEGPWHAEWDVTELVAGGPTGPAEITLVSSTFYEPASDEAPVVWPPADSTAEVRGVRVRSIMLLGGGS